MTAPTQKAHHDETGMLARGAEVVINLSRMAEADQGKRADPTAPLPSSRLLKTAAEGRQIRGRTRQQQHRGGGLLHQ